MVFGARRGTPRPYRTAAGEGESRGRSVAEGGPPEDDGHRARTDPAGAGQLGLILPVPQSFSLDLLL